MASAEVLNEIIGNPENETQIPWETVTEDNALKAVSRITKLFEHPKAVQYIRTSPQGNIEWEHLHRLSHSRGVASRVQFYTEPQVATHWIAVELPLQDGDSTNIQIFEGQRFLIPQSRECVVIESGNRFSSFAAVTSGEKPHTSYEIYIPV
jgi:hypothetical protein